MPELIGKVEYLKVGNDFCFAKISDPAAGVSEACPIWWNLSGDPENSATTLAIRTMQFELLRTALDTGRTVVILWDASSGALRNIKLLAAT